VQALGTFANIDRCNSCGVEHGEGRSSVDREKFQELLALAERHVTEAAAVIQHQEQLIREMRDRGDNTESAQSLLEKLRATARAMVEHQAKIEKQLRKLESGDS
jgi:TolA-binding protein